MSQAAAFDSAWATGVASRGRVPIVAKMLYTAFVVVLVPYYLHTYGPTNFLYFCDVALLMTVAAIWLESPLLASMPAVGIILPQLYWQIDFLAGLFGLPTSGMTGYMFDENLSLTARGLSFFHFWLPLLVVWLVWRLGYDRRALVAWTVLAWVNQLVCYFAMPAPPPPAGDPNLPVNINYVYGFSDTAPQTMMPQGVFFVGMMIGLPLLVFVPTHFFLCWAFGKSGAANGASRAEPKLVTAIALLLGVAIGASRGDAQTAVEPPDGFAALFDGQSLAGWHGGTTADPRTVTPDEQAERDAAVAAHWRVENGELVSDGEEPHLVTQQEFGDFELSLDWKLAPRGDSGVYLRSCPQVQIWDPLNEAERHNGADKGSGALWNNERHERFPLVLADRPVGEWNRMQIRIVGEIVKVVLNDKLVVDNVVLENFYERERPVFARGPIHLQTHGSEMRFDNVSVREIPMEEANQILAEIGGGEAGFAPLFNGMDFAGWIGATDKYEVADGAIRCKEGQGGDLLTEKEYANFVVRLEFKLPPGGNNGLAIRTPSADVDTAYEGLELQVLDDDAPQYADLHPYQYHGSIYGLAPAHRGYLRETGQWNYEEVTVDGDHVTVRLNGTTIVDADLATVRQNPADSKSHPGASRTVGHFGFAGHNEPVAFRNIRIKELP